MKLLFVLRAVIFPLVLWAFASSSGRASVLTGGSIQAHYENSEQSSYTWFAVILHGDDLNVTMWFVPAFTPLYGNKQPFCTPGQTCGPLIVPSGLATPSFDTIAFAPTLRTPSVTIGGVTYTNAAVTVTATITSEPQYTVTTCLACDNRDRGPTYISTWGPFPFTIRGLVTITELGGTPLAPQVIAQEAFTGSGYGMARFTSANILRSGRDTNELTLTFTPEPPSLVMAGLAGAGLLLCGLRAARRSARRERVQ